MAFAVAVLGARLGVPRLATGFASQQAAWTAAVAALWVEAWPWQLSRSRQQALQARG